MKKIQEVPLCQKLALTIDEAAIYSNITQKEILTLLNMPECQFRLKVGKKLLVKRKQFEEYISSSKLAHSCVYFITDGEYVKIGATTNLKERLSSLQAGNPQELKLLYVIYSEAPFVLESFFHEKFKDKRIFREWFDILDLFEEDKKWITQAELVECLTQKIL